MIYLLVVEDDDTLTPFDLKKLIESHKAIKCVNYKNFDINKLKGYHDVEKYYKE
ncbi:hypothetical protein LCGC14_0406610 [marine sediment metagenome]|uniref:Uncharacterized protein n=1 Tax=marine sediment metagenome TaxID=412755 RepID=A0A0F9VH35_9ZZZZ